MLRGHSDPDSQNACSSGVETELAPQASTLMMATSAAYIPPSIKASIDVTTKHTSGYMTHPAVMDAALHLAAGISDPSQPLVLRVPASVAAVCAQGLHPTRIYPSASQTSSIGDTVTCGIKLCSGLSSSKAEVSGLVAKEMVTMGSKQTEEVVADFLYETEMQACQLSSGKTSLERPFVASLGYSRTARLRYGQLTQQDKQLSMPAIADLVVDAEGAINSCKTATR